MDAGRAPGARRRPPRVALRTQRRLRRRGLEDIFHGERTKAARRCLPAELWTAAQRKLDRLNQAREPRDLADPLGNRLEALKGDYAGFFSIRINDQYRIVFRFERNDARDVRIADYH